MTDYLITLDEIMKILREDKKLNARKWLYRHGLNQFSRGKYVREQFESVLEKRGEQCLTSGNGGNFIMSGEQFVLETKPSRSKNGLLDFAKQAMQKNMSPT